VPPIGWAVGSVRVVAPVAMGGVDRAAAAQRSAPMRECECGGTCVEVNPPRGSGAARWCCPAAAVASRGAGRTPRPDRAPACARKCGGCGDDGAAAAPVVVAGLVGGAAGGGAGRAGALCRLAAAGQLAHRRGVAAVAGAAAYPHHPAQRRRDHRVAVVGGAGLRRRGRGPHPRPPDGAGAGPAAAAGAADPVAGHRQRHARRGGVRHADRVGAPARLAGGGTRGRPDAAGRGGLTDSRGFAGCRTRGGWTSGPAGPGRAPDGRRA
jgi:hypothetical protein